MDSKFNQSSLKDDPAEYFKAAKKQQRNKSLKIVAIVVPVLIVLGFLFVFGIAGIVKNTDAYKVAIKEIQNNAEVKEQTGGIKDFGFIPGGSVQTNNGQGSASLHINVNGNKNDVSVAIQLEKQPDSDWKVLEMHIE